MATRPKRAILSLWSLLVMCGVLGIFTRANLANRDLQPELLQENEIAQTRRGVPLRYCEWDILTVDFIEDGDPVGVRRFPEFDTPDAIAVGIRAREGGFNGLYLAVDVAVAIAASVLIALASERFVFNRWRRRATTYSEPSAR